MMCKIISEFEDLKPELVEKGWVKQRVVFDNGIITVKEMLLGPHAKIKLHQEVMGSEAYTNSRGETLFCKLGEFHKLENKTDEVQKFYSTKFNEM